MTLDPLAQTTLLEPVFAADLEPAELCIERDHAFKKRPPDPETGKRRIGCGVCKRGKLDRAHLGAPPSMNSGNHAMDPMAYQALKHAWQRAFALALRDSPQAQAWPRPLASVVVEAQIGFATRQSRDEGNLRWMVEKALGDVLVHGSPEDGVAGGWLENDTFFPVRRYSFGGMVGVHSPGRSFTRLLLFPATEVT